VDADTEAAAPWLATTYIDGPSLEQLVAERGRLASEAVLTLAAGLAEGLASIHRTGLVHRDIKPSNVLIDDAGPHIIDFGIALASHGTRITTNLAGTPSYMAPERIHGSAATPASDVFALGATLFFAATGQGLVDSGTMYEQIMQITTGRFNLSKVPGELRPIIVRCISDRSKDRPTAAELARTLVGSGVSVPAPGWYRAAATVPPETATVPPAVAVGPLRTSRWSRRRVLALGGALGVVVAGGGVAAAMTVSGDHPEDPRQAPEAAAPSSPSPGTVLWQARSGAQLPAAVSAAQASGVRIIVDRGRRLITATASEVFAVDVPGHRVWTRTLRTNLLGLQPWGDAVLVADTRRLWLLGADTGEQRFSVNAADVEEATSRTGNPDNLPVGVYGVACSAERAFLNLGTAMIAIDRNGRQLWRSPRPAPPDGRRWTPGNPLVAGARWLVTRDAVNTTVQVCLYDSATGERRWSTQYDFTPSPEPPPGPKPGGPPPDPKPGGPPDDHKPGGPPPDDEARQRSEARIGDGHIVLRDAQELRVLRISDGRTVWQNSSTKPVAAIELVGELLLVSADRLTAYAVTTGTQAWQVALRGARMADFADGRGIVAATERATSALETAGRVRWHVALPDSVRGTLLDRPTTDGRVAFVTFKPRPDRPAPLDVDVVAVALDGQA